MQSLKLKQRAYTIAFFLALVAVVGAVVVVSGIAPIKASSGHWLITKWFLQFSKSRSVATHSMGIEPPSLDDPDRVVRGAGHYETACAGCHGSPLRSPSPVTQSATPTPPQLATLVPQREPQELYYVVRHGILFTGMPAWPTAGREDEVWDTVAFLIQLPEMDRSEYTSLVFPNSAPGEKVMSNASSPGTLAQCARCHGAGGQGRELGEFPWLAGQRSQYLRGSLDAYATGQRHSGVMQAVAAVLTPEERQELADHYTQLERRSKDDTAPSPDTDDETRAAIERGRVIAEEGLPSLEVPSCIDCHGPSAGSKSEAYPKLAGQPARYLERQLRLFINGHRGGGPTASLMAPVAANLPEERVRDLARYYASLTPP